MRIKSFLLEFIIIVPVVTIVSVIVGYIYDWIFHGSGTFDWLGAIRFGIIFGIIFPAINALDRFRKTKK